MYTCERMCVCVLTRAHLFLVTLIIYLHERVSSTCSTDDTLETLK